MNVLLSFKNLYIERVGFSNRFPEERRGRSPFSDKASLILRLLLSQKNRLWGIRELASDLELDPGFVSRMARELEKRNYAARVNSKIRIRNAKSILEDVLQPSGLVARTTRPPIGTGFSRRRT